VKDLPPEVRDQSRIASLAFAGDADTDVMAGERTVVNPTVNAGHSLTALGAPWTDLVQAEAAALLRDDQPNVWDQLTQKFESALITAAIAHTKGRRVDAANKLGIGRNTITRKIQDLGLYESLRDLR
jgi:two-component system, NtrC family, nitrogen regulation response regulator GlnG